MKLPKWTEIRKPLSWKTRGECQLLH